MANEYASIRESSIHHKGVFATKDIPKGTKIIEYVGEKVTKEESKKREQQTLEESKKDITKGAVYIFELDEEHDIDGNVSWNDARFINHSCDPNCEVDIIEGRIWIIALKDIKKDEELSYDYGYDLEGFEKHHCRCGCPNCIGYIVSEEHREALKEILEKQTKKI